MAIRQRVGRKKPWEVYWNNPFTLKRESLYVETEEEAKKQDALKKFQLKYERDFFRREEAEAPQPASRQTVSTALRVRTANLCRVFMVQNLLVSCFACRAHGRYSTMKPAENQHFFCIASKYAAATPT